MDTNNNVQTNNLAPINYTPAPPANADQALQNINKALETGWFNGVDRNDLKTIARELEQLSPEDATRVLGQLSDDKLQVVAKEVNDSNLFRNDGFTSSEKTDFFNAMAKQLDGPQLSRLTKAFDGADVGALGSAISNHASADTRANFVQQMAQTGQIQTGTQTSGTLNVTTKNYTAETRATAEVLASLKGNSAQFDKAISALSNQQLKTVIDASAGQSKHTSPGFGTTHTSTSHDASSLKNLQSTATTTGSVETRNRVLRTVNEEITSLPRSEQGKLGLNPSIVPGIPATAQELQAKRAELQQQQQLISDLRAKGTPEAKALADQLQKDYQAREVGNLASDVYHWASPADHTKVPAGWQRASENPATLAKYGLTTSDLRPANSEFRAELYIPDPAVFGPDAKPVLAFKGTTPSSTEDWANNFTQGTGKQTSYYDRAMTISARVNARADGDFMITGHSLGGGLASAGSAVTGAPTITFNAAGLHPTTGNRFLQQNPGFGVKAAFDTNQCVQPYQVKGEILTTLQESAKGIDPTRADQLGGIVRFAAGAASNPFIKGQVEDRTNRNLGDFKGLSQAQGGDLLRMAEAAGTPNAIKLDAYEVATDQAGKALRDATGQPILRPSNKPAAEFVGSNGLATRADQILDRYDAKVAAADANANEVSNWVPGAPAIRTGIRTEGRVSAGKQAYNEFKSDPVLSNAGANLGESVKRHGTYNESLDHRIDTLEARAQAALAK